MKNGVQNLEHLEIFDFEKTGRGVKTKKIIKKGDSILKIPIDLFMTGTGVT